MESRRKWYRSSTLLIFSGLILGVILGGFFPSDQYPIIYSFFRFLSKSFIALIKGLIVPLLVSTIIAGIAQTGDIKAVGRMGGKAIVYFEIVTSFALFIGLVIGNWLEPGASMPIDLSAVAPVVETTTKSGWDIALHLFPSNLVKHAADGEILPIVIFSMLFGIALTKIGERGKPVLAFFDGVAQTMFKYTDMVMKLTPLGVFGAMANNVSHMASGQAVIMEKLPDWLREFALVESGKGRWVHASSIVPLPDTVFLKGWAAVIYLLKQYSMLVGSLYFALACLFIFIFVPIIIFCRVGIIKFIKALKEPALTAYSTASSEAALPKLLEEIVRFGVPRRVASFVIPAGYSFNLDGSTLYLVLASLTISQAAHAADPVRYPAMSLGTQIAMLLTFILTSKGVAGVPRATLVIIAAACSGFGLPGDAGIAMILAVDEIMDMARTTINVIGNGLAAVVIAKWEGVFGTDIEPLPDQEESLQDGI